MPNYSEYLKLNDIVIINNHFYSIDERKNWHPLKPFAVACFITQNFYFNKVRNIKKVISIKQIAIHQHGLLFSFPQQYLKC